MTARTISEYFQGRKGVIAVQNGKGFAPHEFEGTLDPKWLAERHLKGLRCLGFYLCDENWNVRCSCVDIDNHEGKNPNWKDHANRTYELLIQLGVTPVVELSQSGEGAHIWIFFEEPVHAAESREFWKCVGRRVGEFGEIYPRADRPRGAGLGNLCRYPYWNKSTFVSVEDDWKPLLPEEGLREVDRVSREYLLELVGELGGRTDCADAAAEDTGISVRVKHLLEQPGLFQKRWACDGSGLRDPSRSGIAMSIATILVRSYVPTEEIRESLITWGNGCGFEKVQRDDWLDRTIEKAYELSTTEDDVKAVSMTTIVDATLEYADMLSAGPEVMVRTGLYELDERLGGGVSFGEMIVIGARPSMGKTAFALQLIDAAAEQGYPSLIVSLEMQRRQIAHRHLQRVMSIEDYEWHTAVPAIKNSVRKHHENKSPIYIVEQCFHIDAIERAVEMAVRDQNVRVVAVDYAQLVKGEGKTQYEQITDVSKRLTALAKRHNIVMLSLAQVGREGESDMRGKPRMPKMSDLKGSGQIEQDADVVLLLHWDWRADTSKPDTDYTIILAKNRNRGIRGDCLVSTQFDKVHQKFGIPDYGSIPSEYLR